ncbi:MAG: hypothetical protein ACK5Q5_02720 [Planctomycetaceae bacterium]
MPLHVLGLRAVDRYLAARQVDILPPQQQRLRWVPQSREPSQCNHQSEICVARLLNHLPDIVAADVRHPRPVAAYRQSLERPERILLDEAVFNVRRQNQLRPLGVTVRRV